MDGGCGVHTDGHPGRGLGKGAWRNRSGSRTSQRLGAEGGGPAERVLHRDRVEADK